MSDEEAASSGGRHRGREVALQVLYAIDLAVADVESDAESDTEADVSEAASCDRSVRIFDRISENFDVPLAVVAFARELVAGVVDRMDELDGILGVHAQNWRVSRMAAVDRNVLRLAVFELRDTNTPVAVVIDEAVDLARRFGSERSPSFVNGVLDAVAREVRAA